MNLIYDINHNLKQDCFVKEPIIVEVLEIDEENYKKFRKDFSLAHNTGQNIIPIVIDSFGGDAYALLGMVDVIKNSKIPVATIVEGKAMSCGSILLSCGHKGMRYISPHSTLLIHDVSSDNNGGKLEEIKIDAQETERINDLVYQILEKNCEKSKNYFKNIISKNGHMDWYMDAKTAIKYNIADNIFIPNFKIKIGMDFTLEQ